MQKLMADVETQLKEAKTALMEAEAEVARIKADTLTRDNTIAAELRGQASVEYQQLEQELKRCIFILKCTQRTQQIGIPGVAITIGVTNICINIYSF
jgi:ribosomal protein L29